MDGNVKNTVSGVSLLTGKSVVFYDLVGDVESKARDGYNPDQLEKSGEFIVIPTLANNKPPRIRTTQ